MKKTEKNGAAQSGQPAQALNAYLPPAIETVEIRVEKGFAGSIEEMPDNEWY